MSLYTDKQDVALNFIFRDNKDTIETMLSSALPYVDEAIAVDTGSKDGTRDIVEAHGVRVFDGADLVDEETGYLADFGEARNRALEKTAAEYVLWLDTDDELMNGVRVRDIIMHTFSDIQVGVAYVKYNYQRDAKGRVNTVQFRERVFRRDAGRWRNPIHEAVAFRYEIQSAEIRDADLVVEHRHKDWSKDALERNEFVLRRWLETAEDDRRWYARYYLGTTLGGQQKDAEALEHLSVAANEAPDPFIIFSSLIGMGSIFLRQEDWHQAKRVYHAALEHIGDDPRPYIGLAQAALSEGQWKSALFFGRAAAAAEFRFPQQTHNPLDKTVMSRYIQAEALLELDRYEEAGDIVHKIEDELGVAPDTKEAHEEVLFYARLAVMRKSSQLNFDDDLVHDPFVAFKRARTRDNNFENLCGWGRLREITEDVDRKTIDILCGKTRRAWTGKHVDEAMVGGSEHQLILMAEEMARRGWNVRIYNGRRDGSIEVVNDVEYRPFDMAASRDERSFVIMWRQPWLLDFPMQTRGTVVWLQDVADEFNWSPWRKERADAVVCLTEWHADPMREIIGADKVHLIGNVVPRYGFEPMDRDRHAIFWSSAPYRGLDVALRIWPQIRARVPDAKLRIAGGFSELFDELIAKVPVWRFDKDHLGPKPLSWFKHYVTRLASEAGPGVEFLDALPPKEIARKLMQHGLWLYTCHFDETFCISAAEAEVYGAVPICPPRAALQEVARHRIELPEPVYQNDKEIVEIVVEALTNQENADDLRHRAQAEPNRFSVEEMGQRWEKLLLSIEHEPIAVLETPRTLEDHEVMQDENEEYIENPDLNLTMRYLWSLMRDRQPKSALSLGCGNGSEVLGALAAGVERVVGIDRMPHRLERVRDLVEERGGKAKLIEEDLEEPWTFNGRYDMVFAAEVLEHMKDPDRFIKRAKQRVAPGGILIVTVPWFSGKAGANINWRCHRRVYTRRGLQEALGPGAEVAVNALSLIGKWENKDVVS